MTLKNMKGGEQVPALRNLKFRVGSPDQSERLQRALFSLGYVWIDSHAITVSHTDKPYLYAFKQLSLMAGDNYRDFEGAGRIVDDQYGCYACEETDTKAFIDKHTDKPTPEPSLQDESFKGLETAYDEPLITEAPWIENDGTMPDLPGETLVDVAYGDGSIYRGSSMNNLPRREWTNREDTFYIIKWRFHKPEDSEYYVQPKTEIGVKVAETLSTGNGYNILGKEIPDRRIDSHYNFTYTLTPDDVDAGYLKIDPYFVSQQWNLGSKDSTGVIFHLLKTIARFGDKNGKEREINALHKSVLRLAQLEGVELK
jgi:hypothetical protein